MKINFFPCTSSYEKDEGGKSRKDKKYMVEIPLIFILSKTVIKLKGQDKLSKKYLILLQSYITTRNNG